MLIATGFATAALTFTVLGIYVSWLTTARCGIS
jgi:hypothetical protein